MEYKESNKEVFKELTLLEERILELTELCREGELTSSLGDALKGIQAARIRLVETAIMETLKNTGFVTKKFQDKAFCMDNQNKETTGGRITLSLAVRLIEEVRKEAVKMGVTAVIAVTDKAARPIAVHSMEDSYVASFDIALNKAYTSAALKMSTIDLKNLSQPGGDLYGIQNTNEGKIVIFGGGDPLYLKDIFLGGLGVSGGTESQDTVLAAYGKDKFKEAFSWI